MTSTPSSNAAHKHDKTLPICEQLRLQTKLNSRYDFFFPLLMFIFSQQEKTVPCFFQRTSAKLSPCLFRAMVAVYMSTFPLPTFNGHVQWFAQLSGDSEHWINVCVFMLNINLVSLSCFFFSKKPSEPSDRAESVHKSPF